MNTNTYKTALKSKYRGNKKTEYRVNKKLKTEVCREIQTNRLCRETQTNKVCSEIQIVTIHNSSNKTNQYSIKAFSHVIEQPPAFDTPVENQLRHQE